MVWGTPNRLAAMTKNFEDGDGLRLHNGHESHTLKRKCFDTYVTREEITSWCRFILNGGSIYKMRSIS